LLLVVVVGGVADGDVGVVFVVLCCYCVLRVLLLCLLCLCVVCCCWCCVCVFVGVAVAVAVAVAFAFAVAFAAAAAVAVDVAVAVAVLLLLLSLNTLYAIYIYICAVRVNRPLLPIPRKTINFTTVKYFQRKLVGCRMCCCALAIVPRRRCDFALLQKHTCVFHKRITRCSMKTGTRQNVLLCFATLPATLPISNLLRFPLFRRAVSRNASFSKLI